MPSRLSLHASLDRRYSPFLSSGNALIGQQLENFEELTVLFSEEEIRALSIDRSAITTSYTVGASYPLNPRYQINMDASRSRIGATRESGGVPATPSSTFDYYSTNLVASSIFTEGDVSILGVRYSSTDTTDVISLSIDTRFPVGRALRLNPRLRVDYRDIHADGSSEVLITPGLRMQYRWNRKIRIDFEAGRRFSKRQMDETDVNRDSYYLNLGYQLFF